MEKQETIYNENQNKITDKTDELLSAVKKYAGENPARFHMPGHKGKLSPYDITELSFSDDLHAPTGGILAVEEACARAYSTDNAFLLVNGSSGGITAFHLTLAQMTGKRRPRVALARDAHRSAVSACALSGALVLGIDVRSHNAEPGAVTAEDIENTINGKDVDAICITSPNYYGVCADINAIAEVCKRHGALLFVDAAHGAHFAFSESLPDVPAQADAFVVSTHKTLFAYNQTGILLSKSTIPRGIMQNALSMVQTTSPSYPLMLSIGDAVARGLGGEWQGHIERILRVREQIKNIGVTLLGAEDTRRVDITRLTVSSRGLARDGYALYEQLEKRGIYAEMADGANVVLITTPADEDEWYERLINAVSDIRCGFSGDGRHSPLPDLNIPAHNREFADIRASWLGSDTEWVALDNAVGRTAAQTLGVYPPGTSLVFPGEAVSREVISVLRGYAEAGAKVFGVREGCVRVTAGS